MLDLPMIYFLNMWNKWIRNICGERKQTKTQGNMFRTIKDQFETTTCVKPTRIASADDDDLDVSKLGI